ncbi:hypothetical protein HPB50_008466 [Hyalomma asiaticum]|uniref:Uncharacterized protein n=1 Tax=Hyalomma asiaticum TaxID=266040 RepID=A0ACB7RW17_HYAAI|nr:hypothetical protein HPB50_008466 [Hyalomma asiaticum]
MDARQETSMPLQGQGLVPNHQESGADANEMDVQVSSHQDSSSTETESVTVAERRDGRPWTEDGWQTVLSRRQKKNQVKEQRTASQVADCNNPSSSQPKQGSQVKHGRRPRRRRPLPPLPREDIKVVLRPHKGLVVKDLLGYEISAAVIDACHRHFDGSSFMLRVHPGSNIIIVSTPHEHVAKDLRELNHLTIRGRVHSFNSYVADPEDVLRGVVHGIPPGTSQADLMANLRVRTQGVTTERARVLGSTKTAIITFTGKTLPRCVYFMGAEAVCYPHKPTKQACKVCHSKGHRTDVCPIPDANVCPTCGAREPTQGHECTPKCAICGEDHITGDKLCKKKLKNVPPRKSRAVRPDKPHHPRWYSSDRDSSAELRSRSRSRSRASSRDRTPSAAGKHHKQQKQQQLQQPKEPAQQIVPLKNKTQETTCQPSNQVSWSTVVSPSGPLTENPECQKIIAEHKKLALENKQLRNQIKEERLELQKIISSLEAKLEARINALETHDRATRTIAKTVVTTPSVAQTATNTLSEPFREGASVSQLQMGPQLQSLQDLIRELHSHQQRVASELKEQLQQQMHEMLSESKKHLAIEIQQQRQYVNESLAGMQRAMNKRVSVTPASSPLPKDRRVTEDADASNKSSSQHGAK